MSKPHFTVLKGGLTSSIKDMPKHFVSAYVTDTRLMGVLAVYARWYVSDPSIPSGELHQFFYIDCEEAGLETYKGIRGNNTADVVAAEQALIGGLGAHKKELSEKQFRGLMCKYRNFNRKRGLPLPDNREDYDFIFEPEVILDHEEDMELMRVMCDEITSDFQLVNYFLMRCFGRDYEGARFLAPVKPPATDPETGKQKAGPLVNDFPLDIYHHYVKATFCKNVIDVDKFYADGSVAYLCESLIEMNGNYDTVISKIVVKDLTVIGFEHCNGFRISPAEAAMMLAKPEFCTVYEVLLSNEDLDKNIGEFTVGFHTIMSVQSNGRLFMDFKTNNDHVGSRVFMLSNDVQGIYYLTNYGQVIVAAYSEKDVLRLETNLLKSILSPYLVMTGRFEFKDPLLFEFMRSDFEDFEDFLDFLGVLE